MKSHYLNPRYSRTHYIIIEIKLSSLTLFKQRPAELAQYVNWKPPPLVQAYSKVGVSAYHKKKCVCSFIQCMLERVYEVCIVMFSYPNYDCSDFPTLTLTVVELPERIPHCFSSRLWRWLQYISASNRHV